MSFCLGAFLLAGCDAKPSDPKSEAPPAAVVQPDADPNLVHVDHPDQFTVVAATNYTSTSTIQVTGTVNPDISRTIPVISIASGRVVEVHARIGDYVKKGQLLMDVQSTDVSGAFNTYLKAVNDERLAKIQLDRAKILNDKGAIPNSQVEIAQNAEDDAKAALSASEEQLRVLGVDKNHPAATVKVYAPSSGYIIAQNVTNAAAAGVTYAGSANAFTIADLSHVWIICDVYENDLPTVHLGQKADIRLTAYPDRVLTGVVSDIGAVLDPQIRTAKIRIQVENPNTLMRIGMFATATIHGNTPQNHLQVPATAVLHLHDRDWVYTPAGDGKFRRVSVQGGASLPNNMQEILSGLTAGQQVISNALALQNTADQ
ncbi:efflux RND transporter periplasmic adaptor subunit [Granulicella sp. S190]|uniref:efflux RND transporter periplasmic adaptor subunit n=1 Tax=Granulicella sp. S190 TaxID=1747226 RepID=UPI0020B1317D|nr:efflux RND transporter periplasmic adaptor subunit [Granulicella sp. S190]